MCVCACVRTCVKHNSQVTKALAWQLKGSQFDAWLCQIGVAASLSKKLYSHCFGIPSCLNQDLVAWCQLGKQPTQLYHQWVPGINRGSKCQLSMSHTAGEGPGGTTGAHTFTCGT